MRDKRAAGGARVTRPQEPDRTGPRTVLAIVLTLLVPACVTLLAIKRPAGHGPVGEPSPFGYTWSLSLGLVPVAALLMAARSRSSARTPWRIVGATIALLGSAGMLLDIFLGSTFFSFPNKGATVGLCFWGFDPATGRWIPGLPIEEAVFYYSTVAAELLLYVWLSGAFLARYSTDDALADRAPAPAPWFYWPAALPGAGLILAAVLYAELIRPVPGRFPGYFIFIIAVAFIPPCVLHRATRHAINWQAVAFCTLVAALVDIVWEATLAGPYGWWAYRQDMMLGLRITAWHNLPVEAPVLWLVSPFCVVTVYTALRLAVGRRVRAVAGDYRRDVQAAGRQRAGRDGRAVRGDDRPGDGEAEPHAIAGAGFPREH